MSRPLGSSSKTAKQVDSRTASVSSAMPMQAAIITSITNPSSGFLMCDSSFLLSNQERPRF